MDITSGLAGCFTTLSFEKHRNIALLPQGDDA